MEANTQPTEFIAPPLARIQGDILIHASPELRRFMSMSPQERLEARRRVMALPLVAAALNAQSEMEPAGVVAARIVDKLRLLAWLQKGSC